MIKKVGLIINPIAGMGGKVGLKGTDGWDTVKRAMELGAKPIAPSRAEKMLEKLSSDILILTYPGDMGENTAKKLGFSVEIVGDIEGERSTREDTKRAAMEMLRRGCDIILFVGGDGTARDIYDAVGLSVPVIGIPSGVKMYSAVFATGPESGGELAEKYLEGKVMDVQEREVMDIDEEKYRNGIFSVRLYGYLNVPYERRYVVGGKSPTPQSERIDQESIALELMENLEDETYYIVGPGTTTKTLLRKLGYEYTLLGVDILKGKRLVRLDVNEQEILDIVDGNRAKIVVSPLGGQGYLLGRGNQQISAEVIRKTGGKESIIIVSTQSKLLGLRGKPLLVDTNDRKLDEELSGWYKVIIGYGERMMYKVVPG